MGSAIAREYNAAGQLLARHACRASKVAYIDDAGSCTYGELASRVERFAAALQRMGVRPEERVLIAMLDTVDWPVAFLGAIRAEINKAYDNRVFITGLLSNVALAIGLTFLGERLNVDLSLAAVMAFGVRMFDNVAIIRRHFL